MKHSLAISAAVILLIGIGLMPAAETTEETRRGTAVRQNDPGETPPAPRVREPRIPRPVPNAAESQRGPAMGPAARSRNDMTPEARREMYYRMMAQRGVSHQDLLRELEAIKKIAQEENATKTVAALDELIAKKDAEFQRQQTEVQRRREEVRRQMELRQQRNQPAA